ncbi:MAG: 6-phospho-3-hexuloisomerase [Candidatus Altiarchaeota archaeon]
MVVQSAMLAIVDHIRQIVDHLDERQLNQMLEDIKVADRIFLMGAGRSGLAVRAFGMRLVQLGLKAYIVGETITPAIAENDLFIAVSGSGETSTVANGARISKKVGARVLAITSYPESTVGKLADDVVVIKGRTKIDVEKDHVKSQLEGKHSTLTPLGTLFEDTVMVFFDGAIAGLMNVYGAGETDMKRRHTSLE